MTWWVRKVNLERLNTANIFNGNPYVNELMLLLTEPHRIYHNLTHILDLFNQIDSMGGELSYEDLIFLYTCALYHDAIYEPMGYNNELRSALLFKEHYKECVPAADEFTENLYKFNKNKPFKDHVYDAICLTSDHFSPKAYTCDDNTKIFLDMDLMGLSLPTKLYDFNTAKIRLEYREVSDNKWAKGRKQWIEHALSAPSIYRLQSKAVNNKARRNLEREYKKYV